MRSAFAEGPLSIYLFSSTFKLILSDCSNTLPTDTLQHQLSESRHSIWSWTQATQCISWVIWMMKTFCVWPCRISSLPYFSLIWPLRKLEF